MAGRRPALLQRKIHAQHLELRAQGNYSDLLVQLSNIYSQLRGDVSGVKNEDSAQGFVRSTTKYWVRMTDVSAVKHHILQHLPVFQYNQGSVRSSYHPPSSTSTSVCREIRCGEYFTWSLFQHTGHNSAFFKALSSGSSENVTKIMASCTVRCTGTDYTAGCDEQRLFRSTNGSGVSETLALLSEQEDQSDSQLINSVYLDNSSMELYHGRLDKRPNAIAIRIRYAKA